MVREDHREHITRKSRWEGLDLIPAEDKARAEADHDHSGDSIDGPPDLRVEPLHPGRGKQDRDSTVPEEGIGDHDPDGNHLYPRRSPGFQEEREDASEVNGGLRI